MTWMRTAPCSGSTSGLSMVRSSRCSHPASSPARSASSTSAEPGTRRHATHRVVGQPRVRAQRHPAGHRDAVTAGQRDHRAEQRVAGGREPGGADVVVRGGRDQPVVAVLEGVGGQFDPLAAGQQRRPVDLAARAPTHRRLRRRASAPRRGCCATRERTPPRSPPAGSSAPSRSAHRPARPRPPSSHPAPATCRPRRRTARPTHVVHPVLRRAQLLGRRRASRSARTPPGSTAARR